MTMGWPWVAESEENGVGLPELIFRGDACWKAGKAHVTAYMCFKGTHAGNIYIYIYIQYIYISYIDVPVCVTIEL